MEKFIKIAAKRHKFFEKEIKAKDKHKMDLTEFGVAEILEETRTTTINTSLNGNIAVEIKELYELYKNGVLTKEEFEKAKKKLLN